MEKQGGSGGTLVGPMESGFEGGQAAGTKDENGEGYLMIVVVHNNITKNKTKNPLKLQCLNILKILNIILFIYYTY